MLADRASLSRRLQGLRRRARAGQPYEEGLRKLYRLLRSSQERLTQRRQALPSPEFPRELPISERLDQIKGLISENQVVILCGETGSGKSTQLPKICLSLGRGVAGHIGHTQPRRIAARSLAARVASELGGEIGGWVGYKVRFSDRVSPQSLVKLMTDGILLAEIRQDPYLHQYDTLIIDEAHERSLNIDFLLGYLRQLLPKRPDLKLIITSATIDPQRFANHFGGAPVIEVSGRTYPVELRYRPPQDDSTDERDDPMQRAIVEAVDELSAIDRGDILVFLSGEREIRETAETLRKHKLQLTEVLPLYARLSPAEQGRVFKPEGKRRIVLATNVAETSLTVPGIRYVIDTGFARISRYSHRSKVQRLPVEPVSQASADQRKGRCGRVAAGVCIRLYSEEDYAGRQPFTEPEIQRTNLASVILQMKLLGFGEIEGFPFLDPPDQRLIKDGYRVLEEIGAVDGERRISRIGRQLARLPVDPRIGRMLLAAAKSHCLREVMVIAAALSVQDPRDRPFDKQQQADQAHAQYRDERSDFLAYLKLWEAMEAQRRHLSKHKFRQWCRSGFLSWIRVQEWHDIHTQLRTQLHDMGFKESDQEGGDEAIHRALLSGLLSHIGLRGRERDYLGARNSRFHVYPGSGLFKRQPK
ncbi:MAG: ATP-dependent RNA helicase HrpA, partial [Candidatus Thiodiazotropha sp.]